MKGKQSPGNLEYLNILYFFKANGGIINLSNDAQQASHQPNGVTRRVDPVTPGFWINLPFLSTSHKLISLFSKQG